MSMFYFGDSFKAFIAGMRPDFKSYPQVDTMGKLRQLTDYAEY